MIMLTLIHQDMTTLILKFLAHIVKKTFLISVGETTTDKLRANVIPSRFRHPAQGLSSKKDVNAETQKHHGANNKIVNAYG